MSEPARRLTHRPGSGGPAAEVSRYTVYAIAVLTTANFLNFVDRNLLSILAQAIKADLKLDDAQLSFLLGTAFAVFYAVVGVSIGRLADAVNRVRLMASGLALWSVMTSLGAMASGFAGLALTRVGVGVGEATATPCGHSLITQYVPQRLRATALGVYLAGTFGGVAGSLLLGGLVLRHWGEVCRIVPIGGACGLASWRAAFIILGAPGLALALVVASLKEPPRAGVVAVPLARLIAREFSDNLPPFTFVSLYRLGGAELLLSNLALAAAAIAGAAALAWLTGDLVQWSAIALGAYSVTSWGQALKRRDRPLYRLTFGCPTYMLLLVGVALANCAIGAFQVWGAPYAIRTLGMSAGSAGIALGLTFAIGAGAGVILGSIVNDQWKRRDVRAPIWLTLAGLGGSIPSGLVMVTTREPAVYVSAFFVVSVCSTAWAGATAALIQDLVLSRMRGAAISAMTLVSVIIVSGMGPYLVGKVSTLTGSLATGMISAQALVPLAVVFLLLTAARLGGEGPQARVDRAEAAGEAPALAG
jgi:MFS family permease